MRPAGGARGATSMKAVLVANRGEIACGVIAACRGLELDRTNFLEIHKAELLEPA
jgi:biotin carboxylase